MGRLLLSLLLSCTLAVLHHAKETQELICDVKLFEILLDSNSRKEFFVCYEVNILQGGTLHVSSNQFSLNLSEEFSLEVKQRVVNKQQSFVSILGGTINETSASVFIPELSQPKFITFPDDSVNRHLQSTRWWESVSDGTASALPIKIRTSDGQQPTYSDDDIYNYLFVESSSLKWQYHACSFGKFSLEPTDLGILTVDIDVPVGSDYNLLVNKATIAAIQKIYQIKGINAQVSNSGSSASGSNSIQDNKSLLQFADMILFITPPMTGWVAFGSVGGRTSVYNDKWGAYLSVQMHEMGEYDEYTGAMGGAIVGYHDKLGFPRLCFNAYNNWILGWYNDRTITLNPSDRQLITLAAFVDYNKASSSQYVVANIDDQLYLQFNRAKAFNSDTYEYRDNLVVVQRLPDGSGTQFIAGLNGASNRAYRGTFSAGYVTDTLTIEICSWGVGGDTSPDYLTVSIGFGSSLCSQNRFLKGLQESSTKLWPFEN